MKKTIFLEIMLLFILATLIYVCSFHWRVISSTLEHIANNTLSDNAMEYLHKDILNQLPYAILSLVACVANLIAIVLIAFKDFPVFKPLVDKVNAHREQRAQAKTEKAKADKQAKIEKLQNELEELKNN